MRVPSRLASSLLLFGFGCSSGEVPKPADEINIGQLQESITYGEPFETAFWDVSGLVAIEYSMNGCSGNLIAPDLVITDEHCLHGKNPMFYRVSRIHPETGDKETRGAKRIMYHPDPRLAGDSAHIDIALIRLESPFTRYPAANAALFAGTHSDLYGETVWCLGYGAPVQGDGVECERDSDCSGTDPECVYDHCVNNCDQDADCRDGDLCGDHGRCWTPCKTDDDCGENQGCWGEHVCVVGNNDDLALGGLFEVLNGGWAADEVIHLDAPNASGQIVGPGDSGAACFYGTDIVGLTRRANAHSISNLTGVDAFREWVERKRDCGNDFDPRNPGWSFCSNDCPCDLGEGDCDTDTHCMGDLVCGRDNAENVKRLFDTCEYPHPEGMRDYSFCVTDTGDGYGPCGPGEGRCYDDFQCGGNLVCKETAGAATKPAASDIMPVEAEDGICIFPQPVDCFPPPNSILQGACHAGCECDFGQGDCDSDDDCLGTLVCADNVGSHFGLEPTTDVCVSPHVDLRPASCDSDADCPLDQKCLADAITAAKTSSWPDRGNDTGICTPPAGSPACAAQATSNPHEWNCNGLCPCGVSEGPCAADFECAEDLVCRAGWAATFGLSSNSASVCVEPGAVAPPIIWKPIVIPGPWRF